MYVFKLLFVAFVLLHVGAYCHESSEVFDFGVVQTLRYCINQKDKMDCIKRKVIEKIDDEMKNNRTIEISDGIFLKRDPNINAIEDSSRSIKNLSLNDMVLKKIHDYFKSLIIQFKVNDQVIEEGRRKRHRHFMHMILFGAAGLFGILGHLFVGKVALMSGTALMVAKLALFIAVLAGLKKIGSNETKEQHIVYSAGDHGHGGWSRSSVAQDIAYRNQRPKPIFEMTPSLAYSVYEDPLKGELDPSGK